MSGKRSRNKGSRSELEVAKIISDRLGIEVNRIPNSGGLVEKGDIKEEGSDVLKDWHMEVKRQEVYKLDDWWTQSADECGDKNPVVIFRKNNQDWRVIITLEQWLDLIKDN